MISQVVLVLSAVTTGDCPRLKSELWFRVWYQEVFLLHSNSLKYSLTAYEDPDSPIRQYKGRSMNSSQ